MGLENNVLAHLMALLRVLCRIADSAAGYARVVEGVPNWVELPLGLVALFWLRQYMPLLKAGSPQQPKNRGLDGLGFVKEAFRGLVAPACHTSALDLRVGMRFEGERTQLLHQALRDACKTIQEMPARYLTHPDGSNILAVTRHGRVAGPKHLLLDEAYLSSFGHLRLPQHLSIAQTSLTTTFLLGTHLTIATANTNPTGLVFFLCRFGVLRVCEGCCGPFDQGFFWHWLRKLTKFANVSLTLNQNGVVPAVTSKYLL